VDTRYDAVITKFNYELNSISGRQPDKNSTQWLTNFKQFLKIHSVIEIDPLECQEKLTSRAKMVELFHQLSGSIPTLAVPKSIIISENEKIPEDFPFPVICKTVEASGALTSHEMGLVWTPKGIEEFVRPILVQQFINHNATIFKVFVIGDFFYIVKRPSIKNFYPDDSTRTIKFNSQNFASLHGNPTEELPEREFIDSINKYLSNNLGLTLIGFDIIKCSSTGTYYIIDANYFPGYTGVEDCPKKILDLIIKKLKM